MILFLIYKGILSFHIPASLNRTANNLTTIGTQSNGKSPELFPKVLLAVAILGGAVLIGAIVAKIVDFIHDRKSVQDDASDMSDYTRDMLKKRYAIMAFRTAVDTGTSDKSKSDQVALKVGRHWFQRATANRLKKSFKGKRSDDSKTKEESDIEAGHKNIELLGYKKQGEQANGIVAISDIASEDCEAAKTQSSPKISVHPAVFDRFPSITVDDIEDDVFCIQQTNAKTVASSSVGTLWISETDTSVNVKNSDAEADRENFAASPSTPGVEEVEDNSAEASSKVSLVPQKEGLENSATSSTPRSPPSLKPNAWLNLEYEENNDDGEKAIPQSLPDKKRSKIEEELDLPQRPSNPVPPRTPPNPTEKSEEGDWDDGVIYSYDDQAKALSDKNKKVNNAKVSDKGFKKSPGTKLASFKQSAKRPLTAKGQAGPRHSLSIPAEGRPQTAKNTSVGKRPKTAGGGPSRTGNRPVSSKPARKITPGVRLKSAKK